MGHLSAKAEGREPEKTTSYRNTGFALEKADYPGQALVLRKKRGK